MSIQSEVERIKDNISNSYSTLSTLGADIPSEQTSDNLSETIISIKAVRYDSQTLTDDEKEQARENIGAASLSDIGSSSGGAVNSVNGKTGDVVLNANDVGALPESTTIPTKTSELTNDSGFLTQHQSLTDYAKKTELPSKTSQLTNDSGFLTSVPSEYVTETELTAKGYAKQTDVTNLSKEIDDLVISGGGISSTEKSLMLTLFKNMLSQSDMSDTVNALETLWSGSGGGEEPDTPSEPDTPTTYTVKYNLTNVTSSNSETSVTSGNSFTATLTPDTDYTLGNITVTMGGIDVTSTVYVDGVITIANVTGNIVITATGTEQGGATAWEEGVPYTFEVIENEYVSYTDGTFKTESGNARTDYISCCGVDVLRFSSAPGSSMLYNAFYDSDKNFISQLAVQVRQKYVQVPENASYFVMSNWSELTSGEVTITPIGSVESTWEDGVPYTLDTFIENVYINNVNGEEITYSGWKSTEKLNCNKASKLTLSTGSQYGAFYDKFGNHITGMHTWKNGTEVSVPVGATHFAVSNTNAIMDSLVITPQA